MSENDAVASIGDAIAKAILSGVGGAATYKNFGVSLSTLSHHFKAAICDRLSTVHFAPDTVL